MKRLDLRVVEEMEGQHRVQRVRHTTESVLRALFYRDRINQTHLDTGEQLLRDFQAGQRNSIKAVDVSRDVVDGGFHASALEADHKLSAQVRFKAAIDQLPVPEQETVLLVVCFDVPLTRVDQHRRVRKGTSSAMLKSGLELLRDHYDTVHRDNVRKRRSGAGGTHGTI